MNRGKHKHSLSEAESPRSQQRQLLQLRREIQMDAEDTKAQQNGGSVTTETRTEGRAEAAAGPLMSRHTEQNRPLASGDGGGRMVLPQRQPLATTNDDARFDSLGKQKLGEAQMIPPKGGTIQNKRDLGAPNLQPDGHPKSGEIYLFHPFGERTYREPSSPERLQEKEKGDPRRGSAMQVKCSRTLEDFNITYGATPNNASSSSSSPTSTAYSPMPSHYEGAHMLWPHAYGTTSNVAAPPTLISPGVYHSPAQWLDAPSAFDMRLDGMAYGPVFAHPNIGELPVAPPSVLRQQNGATNMAASGSQQETTEAYANDAQMLITAATQMNGGFSLTVSGYVTSPLSLSLSCISPFSTLENALSPSLSSPTSLSASSPSSSSSAPSPSASLPFALTSASTECLAGHSSSSSSPELDSGVQLSMPEIMADTNISYTPTMSAGASPLPSSSLMAPSSSIWPGPASASSSSPSQHPTHPTASSASSGPTEEDVDDPNATLLGWLAQNTGAAAVAALISQYYGTPYV
ncbi:hypothetical protein BJ912DRAFT_1040092 [Pholiota molesta]|nr:hypothetical protein BJ912DRAFT_1040092 [Pholiota molesta]